MKIKLKSGGIIKLQKGKIVKALVETTTKPSGIFANVSSKTGASKALLDVNKAAGVTQKRPRIMVQHIPEKQYVRTVPLSTLNIESKAAEAAQRAIEDRAYEVKQNQIDLARKLQRLWEEEGINTEAWQRKAMMKAIEINPKTSTPAPEGQFKLPYRSWFKEGQSIMYDGAPAKDWFDLTSDYFKLGPRSEILQINKPFKAAAEYYDNVGDIINTRTISKREPINKASEINMMMLRDGLGRLRDWWFKDQTPTLRTKESLPVVPKVKSTESVITPSWSDILKTKRPVTTITPDSETVYWRFMDDHFEPISNFELPSNDFEDVFRRTYGYEGSLLEPLEEKRGGKI